MEKKMASITRIVSAEDRKAIDLLFDKNGPLSLSIGLPTIRRKWPIKKPALPKIHKRVEVENWTSMTPRAAAAYLGISLSKLHKMTMKREIAFYKPSAKMLRFRKEDLDAWLLKFRIKTVDDLMGEVNDNLLKKSRTNN
jgi:excisionase family DNA binding protein